MTATQGMLKLADEIAGARLDQLHASWPTVQLRLSETKRDLIVTVLRQAAAPQGQKAIIEQCTTVALEQRCERGTPWDLACTTIAENIRALARLPK